MSVEKENEDKFSWNDPESVVVESVEAIAVYTNTKGQIVIRQEDSMRIRDDDAFVIIPYVSVPAVIAALQKELDNRPENF